MSHNHEAGYKQWVIDDAPSQLRTRLATSENASQLSLIGKHGKVWVCLHDCPNGEAPGIIPNIHLWVACNGWSEPKLPKKLPLFPEPDYKLSEMLD